MKKLIFFTCITFIFFGCKKDNKLPVSYEQEGVASYYANYFENKPTASGDKYYGDSLTAAHRYLPLGTVVQVTNLENDSTINLLINDRGPYIDKRIIDLSRAAANKLDMIAQGTAKVRVKVIEPAEGYDLMDSIATDRIGK